MGLVISVAFAMVRLFIAGFKLWRCFQELQTMFDHLRGQAAEVGRFQQRTSNVRGLLDGFHYAIVEIGGSVRHPSGLSIAERSSMNN